MENNMSCSGRTDDALERRAEHPHPENVRSDLSGNSSNRQRNEPIFVNSDNYSSSDSDDDEDSNSYGPYLEITTDDDSEDDNAAVEIEEVYPTSEIGGNEGSHQDAVNIYDEEDSEDAMLTIMEIHRESHEGEGTSMCLDQQIDEIDVDNDLHDDISSSENGQELKEGVPGQDYSDQSHSPQNAHRLPSRGAEEIGQELNEGGEPAHGSTGQSSSPQNVGLVSSQGSEEEITTNKTDNRHKPTHNLTARNRDTSPSKEARRVRSTASSPVTTKNNRRPRLPDDVDDVLQRHANHDDSYMELCHDSTDNVELVVPNANVVAEESNAPLCCDTEASEGPHPQTENEEPNDPDSDTESLINGERERTKQGFEGRYDIRRLLVATILGQGQSLGDEAIDELLNPKSKTQTENHENATTTSTLPLKFRFPDDKPKEAEMTDDQKEMARLFSDLHCGWVTLQMEAFNYPVAEVDKREARAVRETQSGRCRRGEHELVFRDEEGLVCVYCNYVELGPKDVLPQWAPRRPSRGSERKRKYETEDLPEIDRANLIESLANVAPADSHFGVTEGDTVWNIKPGVRESMYEHQREGFEFLWTNLAGSIDLTELKSSSVPGENVGGCIISHAPGTGKTRLSIVFIETYLKMFPNCRPVIIAPASMLLTWEEEFRKWNVEFPFINLNNRDASSDREKAIASNLLGVLGGAKRQNKQIIRTVKLYAWDTVTSILGISYNLFEKLTSLKTKKTTCSKNGGSDEYDRDEALREILFEKPGLVILDEGHTPRNQRSNIWNVLCKLRTEKRVVLSGTPFQNNFCELFNTLRIVRPNVADALAQEKTFCGMITPRGKRRGDYDEVAVERLKAAMVPFVHVHKGTILRKNLPGLKDCIILLRPPALQKGLIERLEGSPNTFHFEHTVALTSVHPHLYQHGDPADLGPEVARSVVESRLNPNAGCKTRFIVELIRLSTTVDEKVLIFSQYIQPLELIRDQLKVIFGWSEGRQILLLEGSLEQKQRQTVINVFNDPESDSKVLLASTRCCSEGISLIGASRVVLLDVLWNPSVDRQAICRAYRIGQKKVVYTYRLMTLGTTEADKYCRQAEKERLSELVFTSSTNEGTREKHSASSSASIEDTFLEQMVSHSRLHGLFEKIINQPKDGNLIETVGIPS